MSEETLEEGTFKVKLKKPKQLSKQDETIKVDLSKPKEEITPVEQTEVKNTPVAEPTNVDEQKQESSEVAESKEEKPIIEEIKEEPEEEVISIGEEMVQSSEQPIVKVSDEIKQDINLPENIEKVVDFMKETGGTLEDYVRLNADYSNVDNDTLLREYYKQTKSHLNSEEVNFLLEDNFEFDEELDEARDIRKKKLAYKEEVAKAKSHLEGLKGKYYEEIKLRPGTTQEQQKAVDFFNRYNEEQNTAQQQHEAFKSNTKDYFNNEFKGFEFSVGEKKFRYGVKNVNDVVDSQSNINNTIGKFLDKKGNVADVKGYHKAIDRKSVV